MTIIVQTTASASSRDYDWLKESIAKWSHRTNLSAIIPDFVMLAEKRINGDLDARGQDGIVPVPAVAGTQSAALPDDVAGIDSLSIPGVGALDYLTPDAFKDRYTDATGGTPRHYTLIGQSILLGPIPNADITLQCVARLRVPALADSAGVNWLIQKHPDVYLTACMCEAMVYMKDLPGQQQWELKYAAAIEGLNSTDWDAAGSLAIRPSTTTP